MGGHAKGGLGWSARRTLWDSHAWHLSEGKSVSCCLWCRCFREGRRAKGAAACLDWHVTQAFGTLPCCGIVRWSTLGMAGSKRVHRLDYEEEHAERNEEEGEHGIDEVSIAKAASVKAEGELAEVRLAEYGDNKRRDEVLHERCHNGTEGTTHDHANSEIDNIATGNECAELLEHCCYSLLCDLLY